jgi:hypothetical protein
MQKSLKREYLERLILKDDPSIILTKPKKTPKSSKLWDLFHQIFHNHSLQEYISCDTCKILLKHRSVDGTGVMSTHALACKKGIQSPASCSSPLTTYFAPISNSTRRIPPHLKKAITKACSEFAAIDMRAFETVAGDGFINMVQTIFNAGRTLATESNFDIKRLLPDPTTVRRVRFLVNMKYVFGFRLVGTLIEFTSLESASCSSCVPLWIDIAW